MLFCFFLSLLHPTLLFSIISYPYFFLPFHRFLLFFLFFSVQVIIWPLSLFSFHSCFSAFYPYFIQHYYCSSFLNSFFFPFPLSSTYNLIPLSFCSLPLGFSAATSVLDQTDGLSHPHHGRLHLHDGYALQCAAPRRLRRLDAADQVRGGAGQRNLRVSGEPVLCWMSVYRSHSFMIFWLVTRASLSLKRREYQYVLSLKKGEY